MKPARLSSWVLLAGVLCGFGAAVFEGHRAAAYSKPAEFRRFHQLISPDSLYYPPYAMLETLALSRWSPGRTLVLIGGNSILNGVGQPEDELWSLRLQSLLGDAYVVVNLALRGGAPAHAGALVAEALQRRGVPVIYVANTHPNAGPGLAAAPPYGYVYWQAQAAGRLLPLPARDAAVQHWFDSLPPKPHRAATEERLGAALEPWTRHQSLWHHLGYRHGFTVWTPLTADGFWEPRRRLFDNEPRALPLEERYTTPLADELAVVRGYTAGLAEPAPGGGWQLTAAARRHLADEIDATFPSALRPRVLMLLDVSSPHYRDRLDPAERARADATYAACAGAWRAAGIACEIPSAGFEAGDFVDRAHLSSDGGNKLAALVARRIQTLGPP